MPNALLPEAVGPGTTINCMPLSFIYTAYYNWSTHMTSARAIKLPTRTPKKVKMLNAKPIVRRKPSRPPDAIHTPITSQQHHKQLERGRVRLKQELPGKFTEGQRKQCCA